MRLIKKRFILIGFASIIFLITVISTTIIISNNNGEETGKPLEISIESDEFTPLINEPFNLWVTNCPDGAEVIWNMGDGTVKNGEHITHSFPTPYVYNVTVNVTKGSQKGFDFDHIYPSNHPVDVEKVGRIINEVGSSGRREVEITCDVLPGYFVPVLDAEVQVSQATGGFEVLIYIEDPKDPDGFHKELFRQSQTEFRRGIRVEESFYDTPVPPEGSIYRVHVVLIVEQGVSGQYVMRASLFY